MSTSSTPSDSGLPLADVPGAVEQELRAFFERRLVEADEIGEPVVKAALHLSDFVLGGGKRIRPLYGWAGFVGGGGHERSGEDPRHVVRAVSALELIQACALIHDDIIDASDTRRGRPTVHRAVEAEHRTRNMTGDSAEFGRNVAILAGDLALVWADDMWRDSGVSADALARAQDPWRGMRTEVLGGQLLDISLEATGDESIELANRVNRFKTAAYTIERPLHLGAAIAAAPASTVAAFRGYGRDIGIAFQLRDDLLGVFGDSAVTGKPAGDDLREGKRTVLLSLALEALDRSDPASAAELRAGVGCATDPEELDRLAVIIRRSGAVEGVEKRIAELTSSGLAHLEQAGLDGPVAETLRELAIKSTSRRA
ncbi:polyprenyl synthetase family protein [Corynebacterium timonense]|uniref:Geranylgeranyl diphosphate synthase, type I n=1 Tax=Corynebacterium timonense TaxID=441500 RepID=A0A1H1MJV6_9CORY|nr:polyprenyl synthetase family protein [Corynebacterium timonense]SDR87038.1 geranylgeranyl diphosphate synthase, type I [Corynebacterium timonense]